MFKKILNRYDWIIFFSALMMSLWGLSLYYNKTALFHKQLISLLVAILVYFIFSNLDILKILRNQKFLNFLYVFGLFVLSLLFVVGSVFSGAKSWISLGFFAFQPTDLVKLILVIYLARYFSKKHLEINKFKHLLISGFFMFLYFILVLIQPDLGSALIIFGIWFFLILIFGVSKKYVFWFLFLGFLSAILMYNFGLKDYQKKRVDVFLNPNEDLYNYGYNIHQANIALGSGGLWGKGIGEGTQNRLNFLPESETDFVISSFGEEWGFVGIIFYLIIFLIFSFRILWISYLASNNFESFLTLGILIYFSVHFIFHLAINLRIFPVTGITLPFMSYGGSHLLIEFLALAIINRVKHNNLGYNKNDLNR